MPHKFNANRRGKIPKQKYRVSNWASYNESLRRRSLGPIGNIPPGEAEENFYAQRDVLDVVA